MNDGLPILEVSGPPLNRGQAHGEVFRKEIRALLPAYFDQLERTSRSQGVPALLKTRVLEISGTYAKPAEAYAPDLVEEARGIAAGAGVPFEEIMALNGFLDIFDHLSPNFISAGCTTFMAPDMEGTASAAIGQNYDLADIFQPAAVLLKVIGAGPDALMYTTAGMLGCAGMNSEGIGVVINNLVPGDAGPGVPYPFVIRRILAATQIGDAIDAVVSYRRASGMNYVLCDRHGEIYNLETTAADYEATSPFDGPMAHSNHYLADRLRPLERRANDQRGQSLARWGRATRLLRRSADPDAETIKSALRDHVNSPVSICRHSVDGCGQTICGIVLEPANGRAWFARGPCCEHEWVEYPVFEVRGRRVA
ncbi:MAG: C45 family autoproteolytic acyltransferase/hydrolase [Gemmatimonadota bacterium]|nr:C45 family autoproteolytic acyltransferase/hydrolase [Gemmatimonadota bacterium]